MSDALVSDTSSHPLDVLGRAARELMSPMAWAYLASVADDGQTSARNEQALQSLTLLPRVCRDVSRVDVSTTLFGRQLGHPVVIASAALHQLFHPDGERATADGARRVGIPFTISMEASVRWEEVDTSNLGMTLLSLGWAAEFAEAGIGFNCLWPQTYIATAAVANIVDGGGGDALTAARNPEIVADAAVSILRGDACETTGQCFIDADVVTAAGVEDLTVYGGGDNPRLDLFVD